MVLLQHKKTQYQLCPKRLKDFIENRQKENTVLCMNESSAVLFLWFVLTCEVSGLLLRDHIDLCAFH